MKKSKIYNALFTILLTIFCIVTLYYIAVILPLIVMPLVHYTIWVAFLVGIYLAILKLSDGNN